MAPFMESNNSKKTVSNIHFGLISTAHIVQ